MVWARPSIASRTSSSDSEIKADGLKESWIFAFSEAHAANFETLLYFQSELTCVQDTSQTPPAERVA